MQNDVDDEKTIEYIKNYLPQELKEKFSDDEFYYFLDLIDEYYSESGILDAQPAAAMSTSLSWATRTPRSPPAPCLRTCPRTGSAPSAPRARISSLRPNEQKEESQCIACAR